MNKYLRISLHAIYVLGLLLILTFSGSKYDWMTDVSPGAIEDGSGNRLVFLNLTLAVSVATQLIFAIISSRTAEKLISGLLVLVVVLTFALGTQTTLISPP